MKATLWIAKRILVFTLLASSLWMLGGLFLSFSAQARTKSGEISSALRCYERLIVLRFPLSDIHTRMAELYAMKRDFANATLYFQKALTRAHLSKNDELHIQKHLYHLFYRQGYLVEASQHLHRLSKISPSASNFLALSVLYYEQDLLLQAIETLKESKKMSSNPEISKTLRFFIREQEQENELALLAGNHFLVKYNTTLDETAARAVLVLLEDIQNNLKNVLPFSPPEKIRVKIYPDSTFEYVVGNNSSPALALTVNSRLLVRSPRALPAGLELKKTLTHEYIHLILNRLILRENLPTWLNEGLAQFFSDEPLSPLRKKLLRERLLPLEMLSESWDELDGEELQIAYGESLLAIQFLMTQFGTRQGIDFVLRLSEDVPFHKAFSRTFGTNFAEFEKKLFEHIRERVNS